MKTICSDCDIQKECPLAHWADAIICPVAADISSAYLGQLLDEQGQLKGFAYDKDELAKIGYELPPSDEYLELKAISRDEYFCQE